MADDLSPKETPQTEPDPTRSDQVKNSAGGFVFQALSWDRLDRFLFMGTDGGTYYIDRKTLTIENAENVIGLIRADGVRVVNRIAELSAGGRTLKQDPPIFAFALCFCYGDNETKRVARESFNQIIRTGTHLFMFCEAIEQLGGWGPSKRKAVASWYESRSMEQTGYQMVKYRNRGNWNHRNVLRKCHLEDMNLPLFRWATGSNLKKRKVDRNAEGKKKYKKAQGEMPGIVEAYQAVQTAGIQETIELIHAEGLTWEMIPHESLKSPEVWKALLTGMPIGALIRQLGKLTQMEVIKPQADEVNFIVSKLHNEEALVKSRIHPMQIAAAHHTYSGGKGFRSQRKIAQGRGSVSWTPNARIIDALDDAYYLSYQNVESSGKRLYIGIDVSASMGSYCKGMSMMTTFEGAAVLALPMLQVEQDPILKAFDTGVNYWGGAKKSMEEEVEAGVHNLNFSPKTRIDDAIKSISSIRGGGTDVSLPMKDAMVNGYQVDCFVILTDNETWAGKGHVHQLLDKYRKQSGINARVVVVAMESNRYTVGDPNDPLSLDIVGLDASVPRLVTSFARGDL
jgi:60 kDa SS-A/Ro ribonucleoprotein